MKQAAMQKVMSECGMIEVMFSNETSLGVLHDFLLELKGNVVDRMSAAQKEEVEANDAFKAAAPKAPKADEVKEEVVEASEGE